MGGARFVGGGTIDGWGVPIGGWRTTGGSEARPDGWPGSYFIVGIWNSAPSLMPLGQRAVTVLVRVQKRIESVPC